MTDLNTRWRRSLPNDIKPPSEEAFWGIDPVPNEPVASLSAEIGWLHPDGRYFPCDRFSEYGGGNGHETKAREIIYHLYPELCKSREWEVGDAQMELLKLGWFRTDYGTDWLTPSRLTSSQMVTLHKLKWFPNSEINQSAIMRYLLVENRRWWMEYQQNRRKSNE